MCTMPSPNRRRHNGYMRLYPGGFPGFCNLLLVCRCGPVEKKRDRATKRHSCETINIMIRGKKMQQELDEPHAFMQHEFLNLVQNQDAK